MRLHIFLILIFILASFSCSNKSTTTRKPVTNIQITPSNKVLAHGNELTINVQSKITKTKINSIQLFINNRIIKVSDNESFNIKIDSDSLLPGKYSIKTIAENNEGKKGVNYSSFSIISDIIPKKLSYQIIEILPHNIKYYTEGFEFHEGLLYEGTGNYDESFIYAYNPKTENIRKQLKNSSEIFGEGITILDNKLYQLTYKAQKGFVYDLETFAKIDEFSFNSAEGWGLTNDSKNLIMSDGTSKITFINPNSYKVEKTIEVCTPDGFISHVNELEFVDGYIYANIWTKQTIAKIDATNGKVVALINMDGLLNRFTNQKVDVLNGIAFNPQDDHFYVTGKWWPKMYKVKFQ